MFQAVAVIKGLGGKVRILVANPHEDEDEEAEATLTIEGKIRTLPTTNDEF